MKSLKHLLVMLVLAVCGLLIGQNEIKAQTVGQTVSANLAEIKNKHKVLVYAQTAYSKDKIEQMLELNSNLKVVAAPENAEFFINESVDFKESTETPSNLRYTLNRLQTPDVPPNQSQQKTLDDSSNPMKIRNFSVRKTTIEVYFLKADGTKAIVWSKNSTSKISSVPQTTTPINRSTDTAPEVSQNYKSKDDAGELTKSFIKYLKNAK